VKAFGEPGHEIRAALDELRAALLSDPTLPRADRIERLSLARLALDLALVLEDSERCAAIDSDRRCARPRGHHGHHTHSEDFDP
jgi:hypothetical protein